MSIASVLCDSAAILSVLMRPLEMYCDYGLKPPLATAAGLFEVHHYFVMTPERCSIMSSRAGVRPVAAHDYRRSNWRMAGRSGVGRPVQRMRRATTTPEPPAQRSV